MANIILKNVNKNIISWLEDIIEENNARIERKEWKSKYNSYVVYDYEPFCTDGFEINVKIRGARDNLNYVKWLYEKRIQQVDFLNRCLEAQYKPSFKRKLLK